ncbi:MAG: sensor histidine kinase [Cellulosilyticaceae bacterium]
MDTWAKKFKYNKLNKLIAIILIAIGAVGLLQGMCAFFVSQNHGLFKESYYKTARFEEKFVERSGYIRDLIVRYSDDKIFDKTTIPQDQIKEYAKNLALQKEGGINVTDEVIKQYEVVATEKILQDRKDYFARIQQSLKKDTANFIYFARDNTTNKVITNIETFDNKNANEIIEKMSETDPYMVGDAETLTYVTADNQGTYDYYFNNLVASNYYSGQSIESDIRYRYEIHVALRNPLVADDQDSFYKSKNNFEAAQYFVEKTYKNAMMMIGLGVIGLIYLTFAAGRSATKDGICLLATDKIPFEVQGIALIGIEIFLAALCGRIIGGRNQLNLTSSTLDYFVQNIVENMNNTTLMYLQIIATLAIVASLCFLVVYLSFIRHLKNKSVRKNFFIFRCFNKMSVLLSGMFVEHTLPVVLPIAFGTYAIISSLLCIAIAWRGNLLPLIIPILLNLGMLVLMFKLGSDYKKLSQGATKISKGETNYKINLSKTLPALETLADTINHMGEGIDDAISHSLKSERMKTELITNVSHDLKTPLTSIISYVDLLKEEAIENEAAKEYIEILSERSERLKQLIEDLVEASKATTGNMRVDTTTIELDQLIQQIIGEYSDRLSEANLEIVFTKIEPTSILADGRHMSRILENLLSNIRKYAMPYTRVYVDVTTDKDYGVVTIRNISKEPLNIASNELTERFVRGDSSRSEEGSGLGLAIAQSLAVLQKGKLEITIDGDLFKVVIKLPIAK